VTERTASVKERLADAAFALFDERGFEATTVDDIAERAGVGRTTFFRTFRSKEDVIFPDHEALAGAVVARLAGADAGSALPAVLDATRAVLDHYLAEGDRARQRYQLTRTVPSLRDREHAGVRRYTRAFVEFGERVLGTGDDGGLRAELLGTSLVTAHNHVLRRWLRREGADPTGELEAAVNLVAALFLGVRPHSPRGQGTAGPPLDSCSAAVGSLAATAESNGHASPGVAVVVVRAAGDVTEVAERIRRLLT